MDKEDKRLLEVLQLRFPLSPHPFQALGGEVGMGEGGCLERVRALKQAGIIRQIGGVFDSRALGYHSALVALKVPPASLEQAAQAITPHPGVSHNYGREHPYNLWFTLSLPQEQDIEGEVQALAQRAGAQDILYLPAIQVFKLRAFFPLLDGEGEEEAVSPPAAPSSHPLLPPEKQAVRLLQEDLPLSLTPFAQLVDGVGMGETELLRLAQGLLERGVMRRYSAHLHHRRAGFSANALVCWRVPPEQAEAVGQALSASPRVTHCYLRPSYPQWPYNLYTMVHASSREECSNIVQALSQGVGVGKYQLLFSTREFKKARLRYFW